MSQAITQLLERVIFSDIHFKAKPTPLLLNVEAVYYSVMNLISTEIGERLNLVEYGINLSDHLFEQIDDITAWQLKIEIINAIRRWEPRVVLNTAESKVIPLYDDNAFDVNIVCGVVGFPGMAFNVSGIYRKLTAAA